ncbi:hypothetical protein CL617_05480 [archaeon]|nr:hypothetical protein [archaeon]|tara:strand:+ start:1475 stop:1825 length:351 start_codon:yes stop_codon:yes gene_type:complete
MGKIKTIPYVGLVIKQVFIIVVLFLGMRFLFDFINVPYDNALLIVFSFFLSLGVSFLYIFSIVVMYIAFLVISLNFSIGEFFQLFYYFFAIIIDTMIFLVSMKIKLYKKGLNLETP